MSFVDEIQKGKKYIEIEIKGIKNNSFKLGKDLKNNLEKAKRVKNLILETIHPTISGMDSINIEISYKKNKILVRYSSQCMRDAEHPNANEEILLKNKKALKDFLYKLLYTSEIYA